MIKLIKLLFLLLISSTFAGEINSNIITFQQNGGWCWFQDERAIIQNGVLLFGSVADDKGLEGAKRFGNVEITSYNLEKNKPIGSVVLHEQLEDDDHNVPALIELKDDRVLAVYAKHGTDKLMRYRVSQSGFDYLNWESEKQFERDAKVTYSNLFFLGKENKGKGRLYNFYRGENWNPNFVISDNGGKTWEYGGHLITFKGRPYAKYTSNGRDKIHFITTEHHPHNYDNSIYHGIMENNKLYKSDGTLIKDLADGPMKPTEGTKIWQGDSLNNAWTIDMHLDKSGNPYIAYSVQKSSDPFNIIYRYACWDGQQWQDNFLAFAGTRLYEVERHYSGLVALDPDDPNIVYISTNKHPVSNKDLMSAKDNKQHYEIYRGKTQNNGNSWSWQTITENSTSDNIRPIMPKSDGNYKVLLWLRGDYMTYRDYDLDVVGIVNP